MEKMNLIYTISSNSIFLNNFCEIILRICEIYSKKDDSICEETIFEYVSKNFYSELEVSEKICDILLNNIGKIC